MMNTYRELLAKSVEKLVQCRQELAVATNAISVARQADIAAGKTLDEMQRPVNALRNAIILKIEAAEEGDDDAQSEIGDMQQELAVLEDALHPHQEHKRQTKDARLTAEVEEDCRKDKEIAAFTDAKRHWDHGVEMFADLFDGLEVSRLEELVRVTPTRDFSQPIAELGIGSPEIESRMNDLLELLTPERIAEEMDTATYLVHFNSSIASIVRRTASHATMLDEALEQWETEAQAIIEDRHAALMKLAPVLFEDAHPAQIDVLDVRRSNAIEATQIAKQTITKVSFVLKDFSRQFSSNSAIEAPQKTLREVSKQIAKGKGVRWPPLVTAAVGTLLAWAMLLVPASFGHTAPLGPLLTLTFGLLWYLSTWLGQRDRANRLYEISSGFRGHFKQLNTTDWKVETLEFVRAAPEEWRRPQPLEIETTPESKLRMRLGNLVGLAAAPAAAAGIVWFLNLSLGPNPSSWLDTEEQLVLGQDQTGERCELDRGYYVGAQDNEHFLLPINDRPVGSLFFPRSYAKRFASDAVVAVQPKSHVNDDLKPCRGSEAQQIVAHVTAELPEFEFPTPEITVNVPEIDVAAPIVTVLPALSACAGSNSCTTLAEMTNELNGAVDTANSLVVDATTLVAEASLTADQYVTVVDDTPTVDRVMFYHSLILPDGQQFEFDNSLFVFFPSNIKESRNNASEAFDLGQQAISRVRGTEDEGPAIYFLDRLVDQIEDALTRVSTLTLTTRGFASVEWVGVLEPERKGHLNHALAEGRRVAVLNYLTKGLGSDLSARLQVTGTSGCRPLLDFNQKLKWGPEDSVPVAFTQFESSNGMEAARSELNILFGEQGEGNPEPSNDLITFVHRSVQVEMEAGGARCSP